MLPPSTTRRLGSASPPDDPPGSEARAAASGALTTIDFRGDTLFAVDGSDGVFVVIKPIADRLGLAWRKQRERIRRTPILSEGSTMMVLPSAGGPQDTLLLRLDLINGWLFGIDASRVAPAYREAVIAYQRECFAVLHRHFFVRSIGAAERAARRAEAEASRRLRDSIALDNARLAKVREARKLFGRLAAQRVWAEVGLPPVDLRPDQSELFVEGEARH